jgi:hypothetical protein
LMRYEPNRVTNFLRGRLDSLLKKENSTVISELWNAYDADLITIKELMQFYRDIGYTLGGFEEMFGDIMSGMKKQHGVTA